MSDESRLRAALDLAREHSRDGRHGPFGAVVVRNGDIVGRGWNQVVAGHDPTAHAEVVAIRDACATLGTHVLDDCTIYCSCEPCPMCLAAIYWARIPRVVYAATEEDARSAGFDDVDIRREIAAGWTERSLDATHLPLPEARQLMEGWSANPAARPY
jgi:tRNA(Arg) A34 adenosine deaminase TadA